MDPFNPAINYGPNDAGISVNLVKKIYKRIPILGICLGHQVIGKAFGGKDHTTIIHASKKIDKLLNENSHISEDIKLLKSILSN